MKKLLFWRSIYAKFTVIFLAVWWVLNSLTFSFVSFVLYKHFFSKLPADFTSRIQINSGEMTAEFHRVRTTVGLTFLGSALVGTVIILLVVRGIVKPIKRLSKAAQEVAKGNFEIQIQNKNKDEVGQLTSDFNLMIKELKNIEFLRSDFVSNVSHEFKTPITSIQGFAKLIKDGRLSEEQLREYSEIIVSESERLSLLSSNLLKLSELESKVISEPKSLFSLDEQIRKTILILEGQWSKKEIEFDIDLQHINIYGDQHLLQEVWLNLVQNSIKFSNQKGKIKITSIIEEKIAKIQISDNGIGIDEKDKKRIFEKFYKADKSRSKDGNGLGLVIAKKIVELEKGKVYFDSEINQGTTFTVELPLH